MRARHKPYEDEAEINLTPMLDVVFIMLIFFIVTTSFVKEWGLEVSRPTQTPPEVQPDRDDNILIAITSSGEIYMKRRSIDLRAVRANVERERAEKPNASVVIIAEQGSRTGVMIDVMDQVKLAGIENISVASQSAAGLRGG